MGPPYPTALSEAEGGLLDSWLPPTRPPLGAAVSLRPGVPGPIEPTAPKLPSFGKIRRLGTLPYFTRFRTGRGTRRYPPHGRHWGCRLQGDQALPRLPIRQPVSSRASVSSGASVPYRPSRGSGFVARPLTTGHTATTGSAGFRVTWLSLARRTNRPEAPELR
jgi:hypothetical protein